MNMNGVLAIARRLVKSFYGEPKTAIPMLALPLAFTFIFSVLLVGGLGVDKGTQPRVAVAFTTREDTLLARKFREQLVATPSLSIQDLSEEKSRDLVRRGRVVAGVIVPEGFEKSLLAGGHPEIIVAHQEQSNSYMAARSEVERAAERLASAVIMADLASPDRSGGAWSAAFDRALARWSRGEHDNVVTAVTKPTTGNKVRVGDTMGIGFCIFFVLISVMMSAGAILEERTTGTWQRILASPIRKGQIILGYLIGFVVTGWIQMAILILATHFLFGLSWGDPVGLVVLTTVYLTAATAIGLSVAGLVKSHQQQMVVANIGGVVSSMVAGIYWPVELMPSFMQTLGKMTPQYWAMRGYTELLARGSDFAALKTPLLVLGGISVVLLAFGVSRVRFE